MGPDLIILIKRFAGTMPDEELAQRLGCSPAVVREYRIAMGVQPHRRTRKKGNRDREQTLAELDALIESQRPTMPESRTRKADSSPPSPNS